MSQSELAHKANLGRGTISNIMNGTRNVGQETVIKIAHAFNLPEEIVFQAAGILRPTVEADQTLKQITHLYNTLKDPENKQRALDYFELLIKQEEKGSNNNARQQNPQPKPR